MLTIFKLYISIVQLQGFMKGLRFDGKTMTLYTFHYTWQHSSCDVTVPVSLTWDAPTGPTRSFQVTRLPWKIPLHCTYVLHSRAKVAIYNLYKYFLEDLTIPQTKLAHPISQDMIRSSLFTLA